MQFSMKREPFLEGLQEVIGAAEKSNSMPILSHVLLQVDEDNLYFTATDTEIELHSHVKADSVIEAGQVTVSARKLLDIARALTEGGIISFILAGESLVVECNRSRFKLTTLPANDFPSSEEYTRLNEFNLPQNVLKQLFEDVHFSMAQQDVRYFLNGVFFSKSANSIKCVAADGHRLSLSEYSLEDNHLDDFKCIIPRKGILELLKLLQNEDSQITITIGDSHFSVKGASFKFITKLIDSAFPDYQKVIPRTPQKLIEMDKNQLKQALQRSSIFANEKYHGVKLGFDSNKLTIEAHNSDYEEAFEELPVNYSADPIEVGFNVSYLIEALNTLPNGPVQLSLGRTNIIQIESNQKANVLYIVMPMQI